MWTCHGKPPLLTPSSTSCHSLSRNPGFSARYRENTLLDHLLIGFRLSKASQRTAQLLLAHRSQSRLARVSAAVTPYRGVQGSPQDHLLIGFRLSKASQRTAQLLLAHRSQSRLARVSAAVTPYRGVPGSPQARPISELHNCYWLTDLRSRVLRKVSREHPIRPLANWIPFEQGQSANCITATGSPISDSVTSGFRIRVLVRACYFCTVAAAYNRHVTTARQTDSAPLIFSIDLLLSDTGSGPAP
ncbi:hypothetical protein J6590_005414 [Homalodisca vitripennis]|nr:hypothetical protein J6590_005414 [Homalodisca vitripennis]